MYHSDMVDEAKIQRLVDKIVAEYQPEKVILFGSYAWGEPNEDSDVDLLVVKQTKKDRRQRQRELRRKLFPPQMAIDLIVYTPEEVSKRLDIGDFFVRDIVRKGRVMYEEKR